MDSTAIQEILGKMVAGDWRVASAMLVIMLVGALRKWGPDWLTHGKWAVPLAIGIGAALAVASKAAAGGAIGGATGVLSLFLSGALNGALGAAVVKGGKELKTPTPPPTPGDSK